MVACLVLAIIIVAMFAAALSRGGSRSGRTTIDPRAPVVWSTTVPDPTVTPDSSTPPPDSIIPGG